jgi:integrase
MVTESADILRNDFEKARREAGIKTWPANALRHTAASAWCCLEHDVSKVAAWLGNSPAVIHQHYRALLTHEQATAWFNVRPTSASSSTLVPFQVAG